MLFKISVLLCIDLLFLITFDIIVDGISGDGDCSVPPYSNLNEINLTVENEALLLAEGQCYMACLADGHEYEVKTSSYH